MKINVHNLFLKDAIDEIIIKFDECGELGDNTLEIIHGYKHGCRIRDYIRSAGFINEIARQGHVITSKNFSDKGVTIFQLKQTVKPMKKKHKTKTEIKKISSENKVQGIYCTKCHERMDIIKDLNWLKCPKCGKLIKR